MARPFINNMFTAYNLSTTDPAWNLAAEEYVFEALPRDKSYIMLWQNDKAVIVGKYQNTAAEVDLGFLREHGISVVRRLSGGGAVYHDLGNLNFTIITDAQANARVDLAVFCEPVVRALRRLGVEAVISGRNDITVDGKKFSGNAQYIREGRIMHHGTILFDSDLSIVQKSLRVSAEKIAGKGVASVRARVTNLKPLLPEGTTLDEFRSLLLHEMTEGTGAQEAVFSPEDEKKIEERKRNRYDKWEWNVGASPAGMLKKTKRFEGCGSLEMTYILKKGCFHDVRFSGDFFSTREPRELAARLEGVRMEENALRELLKGLEVEAYFTGLEREELLGFLL